MKSLYQLVLKRASAAGCQTLVLTNAATITITPNPSITHMSDSGRMPAAYKAFNSLSLAKRPNPTGNANASAGASM